MKVENFGTEGIPNEAKIMSGEQASGVLIEEFFEKTHPFGAKNFTLDDLTAYFNEHASLDEKRFLSDYDIRDGLKWLAEQHRIGFDGKSEYWVKESA